MLRLYENIRMYRKRAKMTQDELAQRAGYTDRSSIAKIEKGLIDLPQTKIKQFADIFGVSPSDLMGWDNKSESILSHNDTPPAKPIRIPVLGSIPAGIPIEAIEDILDWEELPASMGKGGAEYFALQVKGDSMFPNYLDGDVLIFRKQETCNSGQDCAVMVNGDDATFKRVKIGEKGITLQPLNPAYDPMYFTREECAEIPVRIIGVVVELRRKI